MWDFTYPEQPPFREGAGVGRDTITEYPFTRSSNVRRIVEGPGQSHPNGYLCVERCEGGGSGGEGYLTMRRGQGIETGWVYITYLMLTALNA